MIYHDIYIDCANPIDMAERLAELLKCQFDRVEENQIAIAINGHWRTYILSLVWLDSDNGQALRLLCTLELNPSEARRAEFHALLNLINDKIWDGSFSHWKEAGILAFRYGLTLAGDAEATPEQVETIVSNAVGYMEEFYPAFQLVCWEETTAADALSKTIGTTWGTA